MVMTYAIAMAASQDVGNRSMSRAGRRVWSEDDREAAGRELDRLLVSVPIGEGGRLMPDGSVLSSPYEAQSIAPEVNMDEVDVTRPNTIGFDFGTALNRLGQGRAVSRSGWSSGKVMMIWLDPGGGLEPAPSFVKEHGETWQRDWRPYGPDMRALDWYECEWGVAQFDAALIEKANQNVWELDDLERDRLRWLVARQKVTVEWRLVTGREQA